jgi:hypothetical protein
VTWLSEVWFPDWWLPNYQTLLGQIDDPSFSLLLLSRYALQALLTSAPIFLADYLLGLGLLAVLRLRLIGVLRHSAALGLGMGVAATGIFLFGSFGRLTFRGLILFTLVQGLIGLWLCRAEIRGVFRPRWHHLWLLPLFLAILPDLMLPVLEYDSTMYHMASAAHYKRHERIVYHGGIRFNAQPHLPVMLYLRQWWITNDANLIKLVNLEYLLMLLGTLAWHARHYRIRWGLLALIGFVFGSPVFNSILRIEYADLALTAWLAAGASVALAARSRAGLLAAGLLLGFCAASKLQGLVAAACIIAADAAVTMMRQRNFGAVFRRVCFLTLPVVAVCAGWWVRSTYHTGSPVAPFLTDSPDVKALFAVNARYGTGKDWLTFLLMPWNMIHVPPPVYADLFRFGPSMLILLVIGLLAIGLAWRNAIDRRSAVLLLGCSFFTVFWFRSGQVMRYEACLLPLLGVLFLSALARLNWRGRGAALLLLPLLLSTFALCSNVIRYGVPPPVTWPANQLVLGAVLPYYRATQTLAKVLRPGELVYTWFCDDLRFYAPGKSYGDWFGEYTYTWLGNVHGGTKLRTPREMAARLKQHGFRYVMIDRERARTGGSIYGGNFLSTGIVKPFEPVPGYECVYEDGKYAVFRLL